MPHPPPIRYAMSRRRRNILFIAGVLLAAGVACLDRTWLKQALQSAPKTQQQFAARDLEKYHAKTFTVVRAVDGDTIDIDVPDDNDPHTRIRLWGVDTPETKDTKTGVMYFGPEASAFTKNLTEAKVVTVYLDKDKNTRDKYNRLLAYVQLPDKKFLNEVLLSEGYAYADLRFRHSYYNKYKQLEAAARSQKKGLWANVTREQLPDWLQRERPDLLKKR